MSIRFCRSQFRLDNRDSTVLVTIKHIASIVYMIWVVTVVLASWRVVDMFLEGHWFAQKLDSDHFGQGHTQIYTPPTEYKKLHTQIKYIRKIG